MGCQPERGLGIIMPYKLGPNGEKIQLDLQGQSLGQSPDMTTINVTPVIETVRTRTGRTPEEHYKALQKATAAGDTKAAKSIQNSFDIESTYQQQIGANKPNDVVAKKQDLVNSAMSVRKIIENKANMDEKSYKDALNSASASLVLKMKEAENLGASLTASELGILTGKAPVIQQIGASFPSKVKQFFTGKMPLQHGEVVDDEQTLLNKMNMIEAGMSGQPLTLEQLNSLNNNVDSTKDKGEPFNANIIENALNELYDLGKATPEMIKTVAKLSLPGVLIRSMTNPTGVLKEDVETYKQVISGMVDNLGKTTGISIDDEGKVNFDPVEGLKYDWNHPLSTLTWAATFLKAAKGFKGASSVEEASSITGKAVKAAEETSKIGPIRGRALTSLVSPVPDSVTKSELLMKDAYQITKSITPRGMSKELEAFGPKVGVQIEDYSKKLDKVIGPQPLDEVKADIFARFENSSVAQSNPELVNQVKTIVANKLNAGEFPGYPNGNLYSTNISKMNEARIALNKEISSNWFKNQMPNATTTDQLNSLKWEASNAIKDLMIETDKSGYFGRAINLQHASMATSPVLAELASSGFRAYSQDSAFFAAMKKANQVPSTIVGRAAAGAPDPLTKFITSGNNPSSVIGPNNINTLNKFMGVGK